ncbi:MAG: hypothetical protein CMI08_10335 [Oceanospirillaceae bacterium]|uniref:CCE_0567 family metalloprotein n=1 Tax=unclassified Thalassolituus TaxID=2624967 RepID=UPI000C0A63C1|nr:MULTISPECIES: CCE_0567 family metalloprotein [unclassified Thalassolituus]MAK92983.1 hypothetical protein [Thalassolituus sp.]MAS26182.1 hypothetical protein [Oceanospirillaceae bacterium]MAX99579.1 hypothetical protein [Oceanospirillaceae bacterium]MBL36615.1 hypothetical protein [Oceanospirillaceae bacterium]MBS55154.1 hypothetical protein [Oceanospirillaceae bacterium]|tara:strand:+ start:99 stop:317 length:219 start_codon:yes stop_codon:yes gene_type:complete
MTDDELKALRKDASKKKRLATEWASKIHDVVEDTYWSEYPNLPEMAAQAVAACSEWKEAQDKYDEAAKMTEA